MQGEARELVKEGRVSATFPERHTCRIEFEDKDGLISDELPVLTPWAFQNKSYAMPDVGEVVVCLFASNADQTGTGWIIGSRFHDNSPPNANNQDVARIDFKDKTYLEYDREKHKMRLEFEDGTFLQYDGKKHEFRLECVGNVYIKGKNIYLNS